jgi:hypothetical protein
MGFSLTLPPIFFEPELNVRVRSLAETGSMESLIGKIGISLSITETDSRQVL